MLPMAGITRKHMSSRDSFSSFGNEAGVFPLETTGEQVTVSEEADILVDACDVMLIFIFGIMLEKEMLLNCCNIDNLNGFCFLCIVFKQNLKVITIPWDEGIKKHQVLESS